MAYIGKTPTIGNFQKCDAITVVNGQAAYTMQVGGTNVSPESENHMLVSLNGILQAPVDSFTVSGSTITFASNLATGDVIDFIMLLGNVLDLGVPSDNTVTTAKLADSSVSLAKLTATGTKDSTTFLRGDNTFATPTSGGMTLLSTTTLSGTTTSVSISSTGYLKLLISIEDMVGSTGDTKFTFNSDSGSKYKLVRMIGDASNSPSTNSQQTTGVHINQNGAAGYLSTSKLSAIIDVYFPASTTRYKSFLSNTVGDYSTQRIAMLTSGIYASDNAITSFQLICGTGSFTGGTILIYGVK